MTSPLQPTAGRATKHQSGAFDLPSVLIGVAVVAILAIGVMATIFGVIPWAQDRAAQQDLAAVTTAQGSMYAHAGSFRDKAELVGAGWLGEGTPAALETKADVDGKCYVAVTTSKTGNRFIISHDKPAPRELTTADKWCTGAPIIKDTAAVMVTIWNTSLGPACKEITLPVTGFKGTVDWGDGAKNTNTTHAFAAAGLVTIRIDGTFNAWGGEGWPDAGCLVSVDRWGATGTTNLSYAFHQANNLKHVESFPASVANLSYAFHAVAANFTLGYLDTSTVWNMGSMFHGATAFNRPLPIDTSRVTHMASMFSGATAFNQPVEFDTSKVTAMASMFHRAASFNQPVEFDTSHVTSMYYMFAEAAKFNQPVAFDTTNVATMYYMFCEAEDFNQPVTFSDTSRVTSMGTMFHKAAVFNQPIEFDTSGVTSMERMFDSASAFNQPLSFDTSNVTDMTGMFRGAAVFNQDLSAWNVSRVSSRSGFKDSAAWTLPKPLWTR